MFLLPCQYCTFFGEKQIKTVHQWWSVSKQVLSYTIYDMQWKVHRYSAGRNIFSVDQDISRYQNTVKYSRIQTKLKHFNAKKNLQWKVLVLKRSNPLSQIFATIKRATTPINDFCNHKEYIEPPISMVLKKNRLYALNQFSRYKPYD